MYILDEVEVEPHAFSLRAHDSLWRERVVHRGEEVEAEEGLGGSHGIRGVADDDVIVLLTSLIEKIARGIVVHECDSRVGEGGGHGVSEELLAYLTYL